MSRSWYSPLYKLHIAEPAPITPCLVKSQIWLTPNFLDISLQNKHSVRTHPDTQIPISGHSQLLAINYLSSCKPSRGYFTKKCLKTKYWPSKKVLIKLISLLGVVLSFSFCWPLTLRLSQLTAFMALIMSSRCPNHLFSSSAKFVMQLPMLILYVLFPLYVPFLLGVYVYTWVCFVTT